MFLERFFPRQDAISPQLAQALLREGALIVDVREPHEFASGTVPGAVNVPLGRIIDQGVEALAGLEGLADSSNPVLMLCRSGARSGDACDLLKPALGQRLRNVTGGMLAWAGAGLPTVTPG